MNTCINTNQVNKEGRNWRYYQYCYVLEDYETPVKEKLKFKQIEKEYLQNNERKRSFFAQYITEFDINYPTNWYFTIKDNEYDLSKLPSKKRYEITKAHKFCKAEEIKPIEHLEELFYCYRAAFTAYPEKYRPKEILFEDFKNYIQLLSNSENNEFYATRLLDNKQLIGFLILNRKEKFVGLSQLKTNPAYEKYNSNASLVDYVLTKYNKELKNGDIIFTNGSRSIKHETNFNMYLEKYFGFRKAYAKLRVVYKFPFGIIVKLLKPFRNLLKHSENTLMYNLYCVLKLDSYTTK